jgi:hypothetical protein
MREGPLEIGSKCEEFIEMLRRGGNGTPVNERPYDYP